MRRTVLLGLAALGIGLILAPVGFQMFSRAPKGATMLRDFRPFMTDRRLTRFQSDMAEINAAVHETDTRLRPVLAVRGGIDAREFATRFSSFTSFEQNWPTIDHDMSDLLRRVHGNLANYQAVAALPSFTLFPWFFVVPGAFVVGAASLALSRPVRQRPALVALVVIGVGLVLAPVAFNMFQRAPKGATMMDQFGSIMTRNRVQTIQGYFSAMAVGQGDIRLGLVPAASQAGLDPAQLARDFPAIVALDRNWIPIINDMTPMIGAMSDNVGSYQAIRALPSLTLFPWFFVAPGVLAASAAAVLLAGSRRAGRPRQRVAAVTGPRPSRTSPEGTTAHV